MNKLTYSVFILLAFLMFHCKAAKTVSGGDANATLNTKQLLTENAKTVANFKTLQGKLKIDFKQESKTQSYTVNFRAKKDEVLWISAPFTVVKALITPNRVSFYNKLDNTYFDGDYAYLSDILGTELDFKKVQNLLFGEPIFNLDAAMYDASFKDNAYHIKPKQQRLLFDLLFLLDPVHFRVKSQQITQPKTFRYLQIDYLAYQNVQNEVVPEHINIVAVEATKQTMIGLAFKGITLNEDLNFPYNIPSGYKEIKL